MELKKYLKQVAEAYGQNQRPADLKYKSMEEFVLTNGRSYNLKAKHNKIPQGKMGECFKNATQLALDDPDLTYVEGYALNIIPMMHAWCETSDGKIVDPTWFKEKNFKEIQYFGVAFDTEYLRETIITRERYGLIDNPEQRFPLLRGLGKWRAGSKPIPSI